MEGKLHQVTRRKALKFGLLIAIVPMITRLYRVLKSESELFFLNNYYGANRTLRIQRGWVLKDLDN